MTEQEEIVVEEARDMAVAMIESLGSAAISNVVLLNALTFIVASSFATSKLSLQQRLENFDAWVSFMRDLVEKEGKPLL